jgi:hypothetical protein
VGIDPHAGGRSGIECCGALVIDDFAAARKLQHLDFGSPEAAHEPFFRIQILHAQAHTLALTIGSG